MLKLGGGRLARRLGLPICLLHGVFDVSLALSRLDGFFAGHEGGHEAASGGLPAAREEEVVLQVGVGVVAMATVGGRRVVPPAPRALRARHRL